MVTDLEVKIARNGFMVEYTDTSSDNWNTIRHVYTDSTDIADLLSFLRMRLNSDSVES